MGLDDDYNYSEFLIVLCITLKIKFDLSQERDSSLRITNAYFNPCLQIVFFFLQTSNFGICANWSPILKSKLFLSTYGHLNRLNLTGHANVELV